MSVYAGAFVFVCVQMHLRRLYSPGDILPCVSLPAGARANAYGYECLKLKLPDIFVTLLQTPTSKSVRAGVARTPSVGETCQLSINYHFIFIIEV